MRIAPDLTRAKAITAAKTLTPAQRLVFDELVRGESADDIAYHLALSVHTINNHTRAIFTAFGVTSRARIIAAFSVPPKRKAL